MDSSRLIQFHCMFQELSTDPDHLSNRAFVIITCSWNREDIDLLEDLLFL
jgi:hypothetical protein